MRRVDFKTIDKVTINGKRGELKEHKTVPWYRFGGHNVHATSKDEAIEKFGEAIKQVNRRHA